MGKPLLTSFDRIDRTGLFPPFNALLGHLDDACRARGAIFVWTSGLRTYDEQARIYAIGRTTDKDGHSIDSSSPAYGHHVTNAPPGEGPHPFGIAGDAMRHVGDDLSHGLVPAPDDDAHYVILAEEARNLGLEAGFWWSRSGKSFVDRGHVQLPIKAHGLSSALLDQAYHSGGYPAVFAVLAAHGPW